MKLRLKNRALDSLDKSYNFSPHFQGCFRLMMSDPDPQGSAWPTLSVQRFLDLDPVVCLLNIFHTKRRETLPYMREFLLHRPVLPSLSDNPPLLRVKNFRPILFFKCAVCMNKKVNISTVWHSCLGLGDPTRLFKNRFLVVFVHIIHRKLASN